MRLDSLPDCMMPDGADPCKGYKELLEEYKELEAQIEKAHIGLPKITEEMVDLLYPELIEIENGKYAWNQIAVDAAACFKIFWKVGIENMKCCNNCIFKLNDLGDLKCTYKAQDESYYIYVNEEDVCDKWELQE